MTYVAAADLLDRLARVVGGADAAPNAILDELARGTLTASGIHQFDGHRRPIDRAFWSRLPAPPEVDFSAGDARRPTFRAWRFDRWSEIMIDMDAAERVWPKLLAEGRSGPGAPRRQRDKAIAILVDLYPATGGDPLGERLSQVHAAFRERAKINARTIGRAIEEIRHKAAESARAK